MNIPIPSAAEIAAEMAGLTAAEMQQLAALSGVPFHTLLKIKSGETGNPRIDTVRQFLPHLTAARRKTAAAEG